MKRGGWKTFFWLCLPVLLAVAFAGLASLRNFKRELGPPYRIVRHELLVGTAKLSPKQRETALTLGLKPQSTVLYLTEVESRESSALENLIWENQDSRADLNGSSCV